jgi:imidazolonepropionase-like amidohydrolase
VKNRFVLALVAAFALLAGACAEPPLPETKVIIGATLLDGMNPPLEHSIVIVQEGRITAAGPQQSIPVPAGSEKVNGAGKFIVAANRASRIEPGATADLLLLAANPLHDPANYERIDRRMVSGKWVDK